MKRLLLACALLMLATVAEAEVPSSCLPTLPTAPGAPLFTLDVAADDDHIHLEIWRQPCQDGSGRLTVLIRATPTSAEPYLSGAFFTIVQGGVQTKGRLRINTSTTASFGADLLAPTTLLLTEASTFVLIWRGPPMSGSTCLRSHHRPRGPRRHHRLQPVQDWPVRRAASGM